MIKGLHHNAWRCRDSEETRRFYENSLGLRLASALAITSTKTGRGANVPHTFDLHIALEVDRQALMEIFERGEAQGIETRGVSDHGFIDSGEEHELLDPRRARATLEEWQAAQAEVR
jgi:catechol 2,3-dioxygenase-like lactoylglutathione lyase family enzyme